MNPNPKSRAPIEKQDERPNKDLISTRHNPQPALCFQMPEVFLNGSFVDRADARISAFDAGFTHGVGLFETMSASLDNGEPTIARLGDHLERLATSAKSLGLTESLRTNALGEALLAAVRTRALPRQRVRLTLTGGDLNLLASADAGAHDPTILVDCQPATEYPPEMYDKGVPIVFADARANPLNPHEGHKTLSYWWRLTELRRAAARGASEALVFSVTNHAVGGCVSNVFAVREGKLLTPIARGEEVEGALPSPVLPGVTRRAVLESAHEMGLLADTRMLSAEDIMTADEVFLTNSSWGVLPVVGVEGHPIGPGTPGELTRRLRETLAT